MVRILVIMSSLSDPFVARSTLGSLALGQGAEAWEIRSNRSRFMRGARCCGSRPRVLLSTLEFRS